MITNAAGSKAGWATTCLFIKSHPERKYFSLWIAGEFPAIRFIRHSKRRALRIRTLHSTSIFWTSLRMAVRYLPRRLLTGSMMTTSHISTETSPWMSPPCGRNSRNMKISVYCSRRKSGVKSSTGGLTMLKSTWIPGRMRLPIIQKQILLVS